MQQEQIFSLQKRDLSDFYCWINCALKHALFHISFSPSSKCG